MKKKVLMRYKMGTKIKKLGKIILLGITTYTIDFLIQIVLILIFDNFVFRTVLNGINKSLDTELLMYLLVDDVNISFIRIIIYLPIWIIWFYLLFSKVNIDNLLIRLIVFNVLILILSTLIVPVLLLLSFTETFYRILVATLLSPFVVYSIPYFRNSLKSYVEERTKNEINVE